MTQWLLILPPILTFIIRKFIVLVCFKSIYDTYIIINFERNFEKRHTETNGHIYVIVNIFIDFFKKVYHVYVVYFKLFPRRQLFVML